VHVVRYADDFLVIAPRRELLVDIIILAIEAFLSKRGLRLNLGKTRLVDVRERFTFLGFAFFKRKFDYRKVWVKKKHVGTHIIIVHLERKSIKAFNTKVRKILRQNTDASVLINQLNLYLRG